MISIYSDAVDVSDDKAANDKLIAHFNIKLCICQGRNLQLSAL